MHRKRAASNALKFAFETASFILNFKPAGIATFTAQLLGAQLFSEALAHFGGAVGGEDGLKRLGIDIAE